MKNKALQAERQARIDAVNELMQTIGSVGRRFLYDPATDQYGRIEQDGRGRLWFLHPSPWAGPAYLHYRYWRAHTGGTLRELINRFKRYIMTGQRLGKVFGPWPDWYAGGDPWDYGEDIETVRQKALKLGLIDAPTDGHETKDG